MKTCSKCGLGEDRVPFPRRGGRVCNPCLADAKRERYAQSPRIRAQVRAASKAYRETNPDKFRDSWLMSKYGITLVRYNQILNEQGGVCAGCGGPPTGRSDEFYYVDHDHATGRVRGLLCHGCNSVLGYAKDRPEVLENLAEYLRKPVELRLVK